MRRIPAVMFFAFLACGSEKPSPVVFSNLTNALAGTARLYAGESLTASQGLTSPNGSLNLIMQDDGNLVLYAPDSKVLWNTNTNGNPGAWVQMQGDGNLVVYSADVRPLWNSQTNGSGASFLQLQDDGNLVIYTAEPKAVWQSATTYAPPPVKPPAVLHAGESLVAGQQLTSPSGNLNLFMQGDGNLVLYAPGWNARWNTGTQGHPGAWVQMQGDGNLVVYSADVQPLWNSKTNGSGASFLQLQDDGNLVLYTSSYTPTWNSATFYFPSGITAPGSLLPGQRLQSPNGQYTLVMQGDGNLVLYGADGQWIWCTGTQGTPVTQLAIQGDGNLVLYTSTGYVWNSQTYGNTGGFFQVQDDGNVVFYSPSVVPIWHSFAATNIVKRTSAPPPVGTSLENPYPVSSVSSGWTPRAQWVNDRTIEAFRASFGGEYFRCRGQATGSNSGHCANSYHYSGNALDCDVDPSSGWPPGDIKARGDVIANWIVSNADALKVQYVVWYGQYWSRSKGWATWPSKYGTSVSERHIDHIHISVTRPGTNWFY